MRAVSIMEVVVGAVLAAFFNIAINLVQTRQPQWKKRTSAFIVFYLGIAAVGLIAFALATDPQVIRTSPAEFFRPVLITGAINVAFQWLFARSHAIEEVSLVSPILASTPTIVIFTSMAILHEYPSRLGWIGIWLLALGAYALNLDKLRQKRNERHAAPPATVGGTVRREAEIWLAPIAALRQSKGVRLAFIAALLAAVSLNYDGLVARNGNILFGLGCILAIVVASHLVIAVGRNEFRGLKMDRAALSGPILLALLFSASNGITNLAYRSSIVPYVGSMKRLMIPITIVLAYFILKERTNFKERLFGGLLITAGVICIGLG